METQEIFIENIKCSGCSTSIKNALQAMEGVEEVSVDIDHQLVKVSGHDALKRDEFVNKLALLGYPEQGQNNILHKAKSFVSCATGKFQNIN